MGRHKKYATAAALGRAIDRYFDGISAEVKTDEINKLGEQVVITRYIVPPSVSALCLDLGISRETWSTYLSGGYGNDYKSICQNAKSRVEVYLQEQLLTRTKGVEGVKFALANCYGWREKRETSVDEQTRDAIISAPHLSMAEKLEIIRACAADIDGTEGKIEKNDEENGKITDGSEY